jgi:hypothetical protein
MGEDTIQAVHAIGDPRKLSFVGSRLRRPAGPGAAR